MTATNINVDEFIALLTGIRNNGVKFVNLDMVPDENRSTMNKLVIHPVNKVSASGQRISNKERSENFVIRNPEIRTDNDDIFNLFNDIV